METQVIHYFDQQTPLEGELFAPEKESDCPRAILLFHEYVGFGPYLTRHASYLAEQGFTVFIADIYGTGRLPLSPMQASKTACPFKENRLLMRQRALAALDALKQQLSFADEQIFALGFSFGGCVALELARSSVRLAGAISVYGYLDSPSHADSANICSSLLIIHGGCDPVVNNPELLNFIDDMARYEIDCQIKVFTAAGHGFCNKGLPEASESGNCYSAKHEALTWTEIERFLHP